MEELAEIRRVLKYDKKAPGTTPRHIVRKIVREALGLDKKAVRPSRGTTGSKPRQQKSKARF